MRASLLFLLAVAADAALPRLCYLIYVHNNATLQGTYELLVTDAPQPYLVPPFQDHAEDGNETVF